MYLDARILIYLVESHERFAAKVSFTNLRVLPMVPEVFDLAARLRADTTLRTPDALHAAAAIHHGCAELWTGDRRFTPIGRHISVRVFQEDAS